MVHSRKKLMVFFVFILFLIAIPSENTSYHNIHIDRERPFSAETQGTFLTSYQMYVYVTMPATYNISISWEYWGSNSQANISVLVMDGPNFSSFRWHFPYNYESASNGSATLHTNGIWYHNSTESQYDLVVVYWNNGTNHESTLLTTNTTFTFSPGGLNYYGVTQFYHGTGTEQASLNNLGGSYYNGIYIDDFYICDLYPNDWIYECYSMSKSDNISWHFSAATLDLAKSNVTISVIAIDAVNYARMVDGNSYSCYPLAERNDAYSLAANGTFRPPSNGTWYILFANNDPIGQPVTLMFDIKINHPNTPDLPNLVLIASIIIGSFVGILIVGIRHKRKIQDKNKVETENSEKLLQKLFPFISQENTQTVEREIQLNILETDILMVKEKCEHMSKNNCEQCMQSLRGECWLRIFARLLQRTPLCHYGLEVADITVFEYETGTFFIIKAEPIDKPTGSKSDKLYRQCVDLFTSNNVMVFYLNAHNTNADLIHRIKKQADNSKHHPHFSVIPPNHIKQIYQRYKVVEINGGK